jgi:glyoxylase-like metal-dependent hydrolase (beta-lactamase superfamily II)
MTSERYEVLAIRYGTRKASAAEVFLNYHAYREPDRPLRMDYYFWVARNPARTVVIDTGFSPAVGASRGRTMLMDTEPALRAPGIELTQVGGHTPGQAIITVATGAGPVVLASDAVHYYEELERDRPFSTVANLADMYAAFDQIRELAAEAGARIVAGHDPLVAERFGGRAGSDDVIRISA